MAGVKMVTVNGVRYRPEDAPKNSKADDKDAGEVEHKMRKPATSASKAKK